MPIDVLYVAVRVHELDPLGVAMQDPPVRTIPTWSCTLSVLLLLLRCPSVCPPQGAPGAAKSDHSKPMDPTYSRPSLMVAHSADTQRWRWRRSAPGLERLGLVAIAVREGPPLEDLPSESLLSPSSLSPPLRFSFPFPRPFSSLSSPSFSS